ncbi:MAG: hypothetical protein ACW98K_08480 [Candidatus Kariarchaeaceae archaeon]
MRFLDITISTYYLKLERVFGYFTTSVILAVFTMIFARMIYFTFPELHISKTISWPVIIFPMLVISHPILIVFTNPRIEVHWQLKNTIESNQLPQWVVGMLILVFASLSIYQILRGIPNTSNAQISRIFELVTNEIILASSLIFALYFMLDSFVRDGMGFLELSIPIKIILFCLLVFGLAPVNNLEDTNSMHPSTDLES